MPSQKPKKVVVRPMRPPAAPVPPPPPPRRPGQKAGLTRDQILEAARRTLAHQPGEVSLKAVATELGVAHNSISGRLRREGTTLERELTVDLLAKISRPLLPHEGWKSRLSDLFQDAAEECQLNPGLAQVVIAWLGQSFHLCTDFTEQMLYVLALAGLSTEAAETNLDVLVASLCGGLAVAFPKVGSDPSAWASSIARDMGRVSSRRFPLTYRSRTRLSSLAAEKASVADAEEPSRSSSLLRLMAEVLATHLAIVDPQEV